MATSAQLAIWLDEAEAALHALQIGEAAVQVSGEGRTVIYNQASVTELKQYIGSLKDQIAGYSSAPISLVRNLGG